MPGCLGIMMNTRALMELVVINVGFDLGVIPPNVFTMLVLMAIFSTVITAPFLRAVFPEKSDSKYELLPGRMTSLWTLWQATAAPVRRKTGRRSAAPTPVAPGFTAQLTV